MKPEKYFVLWSGGLDSTYLVYKLLEEGHSVITGYCDLMNNIPQMEREKQAREKLSEYFKNHYSERFHKRHKANIEVTINGGFNLTFQQLPLWILTALTVEEDMNKVALAYVMNDDAISYIEDIKNIYYSYQNIIKRENGKLPELVFPLIKTKKQEIIRDLPKKLLENITFCESGGEKDNCGICDCCRRWKYLEDNDNNIYFNFPTEYKRFPKPTKTENEIKDNAPLLKKRKCL